MRYLMTLIFLLLLSAVAQAQIDLPAEIELGQPIVAKLRMPMPPGAEVEGVGWSIPAGMTNIEVDESTQHLWVKKAGTYTITFKAFWVLIKEVTFKDGDGNPVTIKSYLGHGLVDEKATIVVKGDSGPNPPDPPTPTGEKQIVLFYNGDLLDDLPAEQRRLLTSMTLRKKIAQQGHVLNEILEVDSLSASTTEKYAKWLRAINGKTVPRIAIAPKGGGDIIDFPLPANGEALFQLLNQ